MKWLLVLSVLISCTGTIVSLSCTVEMSPSSAVVKFGDPLSANCSSSSNQTASMGWESIYKTAGLQKGVSSVLFKVDSVVNWDVGPMCFINLHDGTQCIDSLPVTVYKMPDSVSMTRPGQLGSMIEGETYRMRCDIVNVAPVANVSVHWYKGDQIIYTEKREGSTPFPDNISSAFDLTAQRGDNGTQFWCEAKLDLSPSVPNMPTVLSEPQEVTVLYSPAFTQPENETLEISDGTKIILDCTATGNPTPVYSWHFPHSVQRTNTKQDESQAILTPSFELPGTYSCTASNTQGTMTKYFTVVEGPSSHAGTTAGILMAVFLALIFILACVVYRKQKGTLLLQEQSVR
ncbi:intercellular adhesion molecule 1-like isoform X2 [Epinephelus fuscoguttatus]|uniref:intercellular adhesion molecule 1-like isoform X2 n=1 Tax=Epinephelus fuscoguttatus TaxID=293821 RepID=UPI0020D086C0|nr:intercellular adhesion molecule 1-like isoform X2 [Epinephelus fuscoguttatus]